MATLQNKVKHACNTEYEMAEMRSGNAANVRISSSHLLGNVRIRRQKGGGWQYHDLFGRDPRAGFGDSKFFFGA